MEYCDAKDEIMNFVSLVSLLVGSCLPAWLAIQNVYLVSLS